MVKDNYNSEKKDGAEDNNIAPKDLSSDFWKALLDPPACQKGEPCNDCGRCEH